MQPLSLGALLPEKAKQVDFARIKDHIENKNIAVTQNLSFDVQFYFFSVFQLVLANFLIFNTVRLSEDVTKLTLVGCSTMSIST
jgi:hypothetical protein